MGGVLGVTDQFDSAIAHTVGNSLRFGTEFLVPASRECQGRHDNVFHPWREPRLRPGAGETQRVGQPVRVATARGALLWVVGKRGEHWLSEPLVEKLIRADEFDSFCQSIIARASLLSKCVVLDAARGAEKY